MTLFVAEMMGFQVLGPQKELFEDLAYHVYPVMNKSLSIMQRGHYKPFEATSGTFYVYEPPQLELYTQFSLQTYFLVFWGILLLQRLIIFIADYVLVKNIPPSATLWQRFIHATQKSHSPFPYTKWHQGNGSCQDHVNRKNDVQQEVLTSIGINLVFNMILLFPLVILCKNTLMLVYHCHKPVFTPKMAIFQRAGIREGGLPLPLAFQYLILLI